MTMSGITTSLLGTFLLGTLAVAPSAASAALDQATFQRLVDAGIQPQALKVAVKAYDWANAQGKVKKHVMTLVDFTKPSVKKRLWVIDMNNGKILFHGLVAHGKASGSLYATHFTDKPGSDSSVLGAMVTGSTYEGKHGLELKIHGLEKGLNDKVYSRAVIFHSAHYATPAFAAAHGYLGHSWGCFALNPQNSNYVINQIKGGSFVFSYAPQERHDSTFS